MTLRNRVTALLSGCALLFTAACGGGSGGANNGGGSTPTPTTPQFAVPAQEALTALEVEQIVAQAVGEAQARGAPAIISVVDRVGNVLALFKMNGAPDNMIIPLPDTQGAQAFDFQGAGLDPALRIPAAAGAISKAVTSAYLSSSGNAFNTRTASDIVQEHFPRSPQTTGLESGPLFGVQFSSLPCSDLNLRFGEDAFRGPKRSPLGLAADPGAVPLYKNGVVVGGVGVMIADGANGFADYSYDRNTADVDTDIEEYIALAASTGFEAPQSIEAERISIDGTLLSFLDADRGQLQSNPANRPALGPAGAYIAFTGYYAGGGAVAGTPYGSPASGYRAVTQAERTAGTAIDNPDAFILVDAAGNNRFPIRGGTDTADVAQPLTAAEVKAVAEEAFKIMTRARGAIRQPLDSRMQATISIVDTRGQVLAIQRSPDAPVFGTDVSLQKARTAAFFSNPNAAAELNAATGINAANTADLRSYVQRTRDFLGDQTALTGTKAYAERPIGLLSRPFFPDGQVNTAPGPLSRPIASFSPFSTGLQSALIFGDVAQGLLDPINNPRRCATALPNIAGTTQNRLQNGTQIFPGGVPIYRGNVLVGAIGVSGDGIDQDDMVSFLGLSNGAARVGSIGHAASSIRISTMQIQGGFLPYVQCPIAPFLDTSEQNVCQGR
jgi:uncharacterized protein GlcG (DUF336 family)